jgi:protein gp37
MEKSKIQWTDATWNPFYGCRKVSTECKFCYMYRDQQRYGRNPAIVTKAKTTFNKPLSWKEPKLIFTCSWSDWFIEEADEWRDELWKIIKATPQHTYQILTKRPERILQCLPADWGEGYDNVWLGISVGNNKSLHRCKTLGEIPAKIKFISAEPLLEELNELNEILKQYKFDWCIIGGESGNNIGKYRFRKCYIEWIEDVINTCQNNNVKVFVKQL